MGNFVVDGLYYVCKNYATINDVSFGLVGLLILVFGMLGAFSEG
jgi:hypothetical protein